MSVKDELRARLERLDKTGKEKPIAPMVVRETPMISVTLDELRSACQANPDHPKARDFMDAIRKAPPGKDVLIERIDLQALLDNKDVQTKVTVEDGDADGRLKVARKVLVDRKQPVKPVQPPKPEEPPKK